MDRNEGNGPSDRPQKKGRTTGTPGARKQTSSAARKRSPKPVQAAEDNGTATVERGVQLATAYDVKEIHRSLAGFTDDDLKQIPIIPAGTHLEQGATYIDLAEDQPSEVKVNAGVIARDGHYYVPKSRVPYTIWNRLIGEAKPGQERSGVEDRPAGGGTARTGARGEATGEAGSVVRSTSEIGGTPGRQADRTPAEVGDAGRAAGERSFAAGDGADRSSDNGVGGDAKSWLDSRREDRDEPREVL